MSEDELKEIEARAAAACHLVGQLASGAVKWTMCVPVQDDDTDMALSWPLDQIPAMAAALREAWAKNAKLTFALVRIRLAQERRGEKDGIWAIADAALTREQAQPQEGTQEHD